jgi:hypothetical protein
MIDIPTLRADDTEELEVTVEQKTDAVSVALCVDGAEMILVLSQDRFNVVTDALLTYRTSKERVEVFSQPRREAILKDLETFRKEEAKKKAS